jgi:hypothetical protein
MGAFCINAFMNSILPVIYRGACTILLFHTLELKADHFSYLVYRWLCYCFDHSLGLRFAGL